VIQFVVYGKPQPAGSKRAFPFKKRDGKIGVAVSDANPNSRDWKNAVASAAREAFTCESLIDGPVRLYLEFYLPRPKSHLKSNGDYRGSAPLFHVQRPDVLKLARGVEDALTGVIWRDDSQIFAETLGKSWGEPARVEVRIEAIPYTTQTELTANAQR
jgi:Holliday junction resolvase RusA-like endonuclease